MPLMSLVGDFAKFEEAVARLADRAIEQARCARSHKLNDFLPPVMFCKAPSSLIVFSVPSPGLRLSGESADASGVVPQEESSPICDIDEAGEAVMDVDDAR